MDAERKRLQDALLDAAEALLRHEGARAAKVGPRDGITVYAGPVERVALLVAIDEQEGGDGGG